jgi:hypothetical protein
MSAGMPTDRIVILGHGTVGSTVRSALETWGADPTVVDIDDAKTQLLRSSDMQGQKPGDLEDPNYIQSTYSQASYQGRPLRTTDGTLVFSASEAHVSEFLDEEELGL